MINPNLRHLKRESGVYRMRRGLCESCGLSASCKIASLEAVACTAYQPVLAFKSLGGTEGQFNTFRLGSAWAARVQVGQLVGLLDGKCEKVGEAVIEAVHCGGKAEMLRDHAYMNHLMLANPHIDPVGDLARRIRNLYGTNFMNRAEKFTVIYLRRL